MTSRVAPESFRRSFTIGTSPLVRVSAIDTGEASEAATEHTLLFFHGAGGRSNQWHAQIAAFAPRWRCVAPDMRGHGASDAPPGTYDLPELMADVDHVVEALALPPRFVVVAHSFGGALGISYAATRPERVEKLVLIATAPRIPLNPLLKVLLRLPPAALDLVRRGIPNRISSPAWVLRRFIPAAVFPWDGEDLLGRIQAPTLVVVGEWDRVIPRQASQAMADAIRGARLDVVKWAWHMPILERPDAVNRAIERFVEERVTSWRGTVEEVAAK